MGFPYIYKGKNQPITEVLPGLPTSPSANDVSVLLSSLVDVLGSDVVAIELTSPSERYVSK